MRHSRWLRYLDINAYRGTFAMDPLANHSRLIHQQTNLIKKNKEKKCHSQGR